MNVKRSTGKNLPSWPALLKELLQIAITDGIKFSGLEEDIKIAISEGKVLMVAQELEDNIPKAALNKYLRKIFLDRNLTPGQVHKSLMQIPFIGYLTTNYDTLLEGAYTISKDGRLPPVYTQEDLLTVPNPLRVEDDFIFKIHGDVNRPDTVILSSHDYHEILFRTPHYRSFMETLFTVNTVLFLGFGLVDPDTDLLLDRLSGIYARNNEHHYALVEKGKYSELEKKRLAIDKRIRLIEYDNPDGKHTQVGDFLIQLAELTSKDGTLKKEYQEKAVSAPAKKETRHNWSVFLSYAPNDKPMAQKIANFLYGYGIEVWFDQSMIKIGDTIISKIEEGIESSAYMFVLVPSRGMREFQQKELEVALFNKQKGGFPIVVPVILESEAKEKIPASLRAIQWLDLSEDFDDNLINFIKQIKGE